MTIWSLHTWKFILVQNYHTGMILFSFSSSLMTHSLYSLQLFQVLEVLHLCFTLYLLGVNYMLVICHCPLGFCQETAVQTGSSGCYHRAGGCINREAGVSWTQGNQPFERPVARSVPPVHPPVSAKGRGPSEDKRVPWLHECRGSVPGKIYYRMGQLSQVTAILQGVTETRRQECLHFHTNVKGLP